MSAKNETWMNTMTDCTNHLLSQGYREEFQIGDLSIKSLSDDISYLPKDVHISNFYRFEGMNDPSDSAILYAVETHDGKKGLLIDAYGANADPRLGEFIKQIATITKKLK